MFRGIIFDLYDTLIHIEKKINPYLSFFKDMKLDVTYAMEIALTEDLESFAALANRLNLKKELDEFTFYENKLKQELETVTVYIETIKVLQEIKCRNIPTAVISNLASPYRKPYFNLELDSLIDFSVFSCEVGLRKPDAKIYHIAIEKWNFSPKSILMVGDSYVSDFQAAKAVGINAVHLKRGDFTCKLPEQIHTLSDLFAML